MNAPTPLTADDYLRLGYHPADKKWLLWMFNGRADLKKQYGEEFRRAFLKFREAGIPEHRLEGAARRAANMWLVSHTEN